MSEGIRKNIKSAGGRVLYEDGTYLVVENPKDPSSHDLLVNEVHAYLPRDTLDQFATTHRGDLINRLRNLGRGNEVMQEVYRIGESVSELGWALARAEITRMRTRQDED